MRDQTDRWTASADDLFRSITQRRRRSPARSCYRLAVFTTQSPLNQSSKWLGSSIVPLRDQTACRCARPDGATLLTSSSSLNSPGLYRRNNVPHWQRMHQTHDGLRQWQKGPRAKMMLYPYYALLASTSAATMYMMGRMVLVRPTLEPTRTSYTTSLTRYTGPQDLVLQQLNNCLLYITAIELLHAKSTIPTTKQLLSISLLSSNYCLSYRAPLAPCCCLHVQVLLS
jgi:hypothetical protein